VLLTTGTLVLLQGRVTKTRLTFIVKKTEVAVWHPVKCFLVSVLNTIFKEH